MMEGGVVGAQSKARGESVVNSPPKIAQMSIKETLFISAMFLTLSWNTNGHLHHAIVPPWKNKNNTLTAGGLEDHIMRCFLIFMPCDNHNSLLTALPLWSQICHHLTLEEP